MNAPAEPTEDEYKKRAEHIPDHLANERTLLSWIRLGLSLTALGFVIDRFGIFLEQMVAAGQFKESTPHCSVPIGVGWAVLDPILTGLAARRFFDTERGISLRQARPTTACSLLYRPL